MQCLFNVFCIIYSNIRSLFRQLHTVNSAATLFDVKLEQKRTLILTPSISAIVLEVLISFPWQRNTNQQTNNAILELAI
jgi:hypothetical protein